MTGAALGIDIGTTGVKVIAVAEREILATAGTEYPSDRGPDGRHEQDPNTWWSAVCASVHHLFAQTGPLRIASVGLSGHMHALLLIGNDNRPVWPALTWADRRVSAQTNSLNRDPRFRSRSGNDVSDAFTAPKLAWFSREHPELLARSQFLVAVKDYIGYLLTGSWASDPTDAMGTLLWNIERAEWDEDLFALCGASSSLGVAVHDSAAPRGKVTVDAARATGLPVGTVVACGAGDVSAAALGSGALAPNAACLNAGTAAQVMVGTPAPDPGRGFLFGRAGAEGYLRMASVYAAGDSVRWAQSRLLDGRAEPEIADTVDPDVRGLTYLPFMYGSAVPRKNDQVRAALLGQQDHHGPAELMAAVLDGVAYACADALDAVSDPMAPVTRVQLVGGMVRSHRWRRALAAVLDAEVVSVEAGGSALGAAALGWVASGSGGVEEVLDAARQGHGDVPDKAEQTAFREARARFQDWCELLV